MRTPCAAASRSAPRMCGRASSNSRHSAVSGRRLPFGNRCEWCRTRTAGRLHKSHLSPMRLLYSDPASAGRAHCGRRLRVGSCRCGAWLELPSRKCTPDVPWRGFWVHLDGLNH
jgi:hypothetical protein